MKAIRDRLSRSDLEIHGRYNFDFSLDRTLEDSSTEVKALVAHAVSPSGIQIPIRCVWKRIVEDRVYVLDNISSKCVIDSVYQISSADLGAYISVEVTPIDTGEEYSGSAEARYGPVTLCSKLRQNLEYALATGGSTFSLYLAPESLDAPRGRNEVRLTVGREELDLQVYDEKGTLDEGMSLRTGYTIEYPAVSLHPFDTKRFTLTVKQKGKTKRVQLMSMTRQNRDLIVLTIRCLAARKYLVNSKTLQDLFTTDGNLQSQGGTVSSPLDLMLEIDRTVRELYSLMKVNDDVVKERNKLKEELRETEDDMRETIASYQSMLIAAAEAPATEGRWKQELDLAIDQKNKLRKQYSDAMEEIERLKRELDSCRERESTLQSQASVLQAQSNYEKVIEDQNELIEVLKRRLETSETLKAELAAANIKSAGQSKMIVELSAQIEEMAGMKAEMERLEELGRRNAVLEEEAVRLREENAALLGQRGFMAKRIDALSEEVEAGKKKVEELVSLQDETRGRHEVAIQKLLSEIEAMDRAADTAPDFSSELAALQAENTQLKAQCDTLAAQLSRAQALARRPTRPDM